MDEILPGVFHWRTRHPKIGSEVSSYWLEPPGVLFDPLIPPDDGLEWFAKRPARPTAIVLSNRHHYRDSARFAECFDCAVHCNREGLHELSGEQPVRGFGFGEGLAGGSVVACEVDAICPDETALHLPGAGALVIADGVVRGGPYGQEGPLGFVPDSLMDDPPATKRGLLSAYGRLLEEVEFDHLLLAHGGPVLDEGRALLQDLVNCGGRTAFEF